MIFSCLHKLLCHIYSHLIDLKTWTWCSVNCVRLYFLLKVGSQETSCLKPLERLAFLSQDSETTSKADELYPIHFHTVKLKRCKFRTDEKEIPFKAEPAGPTETSGAEPSTIVLVRGTKCF